MLLVEIAKGMGVTLKNMFRPPVTIQYPEVKRPLGARDRGMPVLRTDPATGQTRCVACGLCEVACPNRALVVRAEPAENRRDRVLREYTLDLNRCIWCGMCAEACPVEAIVMSHHHELGNFHRGKIILNKEELLELGRDLV